MELFEREIKDPELDKVRSSVDQINHFLSSMVWQDLKEIVESQLQQKHLLLETAPEEQLKGLQEAIKTLRLVLDLPQMLLDQREDEDKDRPKKEEDE